MGRRMLSGRDGAAGYLQFQNWEAERFSWLNWVLVGLWGHLRMGRWMLRGVTSSPSMPTQLHLRRGSSCCPGAEDGEEPAKQETSDSARFGMTPGVCHPRQESTWAWSRRGGAEGRGCHQGQGWGGWVQPSITPVSPTGGWGRG